MCEWCEGELARERPGYNVYTGYPDHRHCQRKTANANTLGHVDFSMFSSFYYGREYGQSCIKPVHIMLCASRFHLEI